MNMISTGAFLNEMDASNKQPTVAEKFAAVWEKKNAKAARAGGVSLMALSLAACGSSSDDTETPVTPSDNSGVTPIASDLTNGSDLFTGTSGNDTITAGAVYTPGGNDRINSLQDEDVINGGAGDDTLDITVTTANDNGNVTITPTVNSVENINIAFASSNNNSEIDFQDIGGGADKGAVEDIVVSRISSATVTLDNIQDAIKTLHLGNTHEDTTTINVQFDDEVLAGTGATSETLKLTTDDVQAATVQIDGEDGNGFETIDWALAGDTSIATDLAIDSTNEIIGSGAGDLTIAGMSLSAGDLDTINGTSATGDWDIDLGADNIVEARITGSSGLDIDFDYDGSQGDDYIRVDEDSLSAAQTGGEDDDGHDDINGGAGNNTLDFTVDATADLIHNDVTVSNIQNVRIDITAVATADLDGQQFGEDAGSADLAVVTLRNDGATAVADFDLNDLDAGVLVQVQHASDDGDSTTAANTDVYIHQMDGSATDNTQTVEIISGTNTAESFNFTLNVQANDDLTADRDDAEVESLTIIDSDNEDNTIVLSSAAEHDGTLTLSGGRADDAFVIDDANAVVAVVVDGREQRSDVTIDVGAANQDIDMGTGDDNIVFVTADTFTDDDDVNGGDGTDTVTAQYTANSDDDLQLTAVEVVQLAADEAGNAAITVDISEADDVHTVNLMSDNHEHNTVDGAAADVINLIADNISTINLVTTAANANDIYNGLTITDEDANNPAAVTINLGDAENDAVTVGVITLDNDTTSLTINNGDDDDANVTTFNGVLGAALTSLTVTDSYTAANDTNYESVINLDDTVALTSIDATGALGGVNINVEALADNATIDLRNVDDVEADADDALTVTFVGDTGADNLTITGGAGVETITITNGDLDDLTINAGAGDDVIDLTGTQGANMEINGGAGNDTITGSDDASDDDEISGGAGDDIINTTDGDDMVSLGDGDDDVIFLVTNSNTTITDFDADDGAVADELHFSIANLGLNAADYAIGASVLDTEANVDALGAGNAANHIILDTAANIATFDNANAEYAGAAIAIETDTGNILFDADADFTAGAITIGNITAAEAAALVAGNVDIIA